MNDTLQVVNTALLAAIALAVPLNTWLAKRDAEAQSAQLTAVHADTVAKVAEVHASVQAVSQATQNTPPP